MTDRRSTFANDRVVHQALALEFPGLRPVASRNYRVCQPVVDLSLSHGGRRDRQLLYGEFFEVIEIRGELAFGMSGECAPYAGWVPIAALREEGGLLGDPLSVAARQTHAYSEPDFKSPEGIALPHGAQVVAVECSGRFTRTEAGWIPTVHLTQEAETDPVTVAERYLGTPYLWGGNSCWGIDCSGLVQAGCVACGIACPGDSDMQEAELGEDLGNRALARGDLLFWKGHVAWVADETTLIHANAYHMAVAFEGIEEAIARIERQGDGALTARRRLERQA